MAKPICVVEDNAPIRKLFCTLLKKAGFEVVDFGDGASASGWLKNNQPLLLLVDILLPDMNGSDIMLEFKALEHGKDIPTVAATGLAHSQDREKFLAMGFDAYLIKPINTATFAKEIQDVIDQKNESKQ
jgi:CheY-like chemotaxis protein